MTHETIMNFIATLRRAHQSIAPIFTHGACYEFYRIMKVLDGSAEPWYDGQHVYVKIGERLYDIDGENTFTAFGERQLRRMNDDDELNAQFWAIKQYSVDKMS